MSDESHRKTVNNRLNKKKLSKQCLATRDLKVFCWWLQLGPLWDEVRMKCVRGRYQPLLLIYQSSVRTPISTATAPSLSFLLNDYVPKIKVMSPAGHFKRIIQRVVQMRKSHGRQRAGQCGGLPRIANRPPRDFNIWITLWIGFTVNSVLYSLMPKVDYPQPFRFLTPKSRG